MLCALAPIAAQAQGNDVPFGNDAYHIIDRLDIKTETETPIFTGTRPLKRGTITQLALVLDTLKTTELRSDDRRDLFYIYKDNNLLLRNKTEDCPDDDKYILSEKPIFNLFYKTPANLYEVNTPHFAMSVNPILDVSVGREINLDRTIFNNTRGLRIEAAIDNKVWFSSTLYENQTRFASYIDRDVREKDYVPGGGYYKVFASRYLKGVTDAKDYFNAEAAVSVQATKHIGVQFGHGRNFIGEGYRSLFLSDYGMNYFYLKLNTKVWKFDYQNIFAELTRDNVAIGGSRLDTLLGKKYLAAHHLSFRPFKNLTIGAYEAVVFSRREHFEFQYLNPVIFYRTVEQFLGSSDNALIGLDAKWNVLHRGQIYGQFILDEFKLSEILSSRGSWVNKYGLQLGAKYIDMLGVSHLDGQIEYNMVRPYTYSHRDFTANYTSNNQPLAHPYGANFNEILGIIRYQPIKKLQIRAQFALANVGKDSVALNTIGGFMGYTNNMGGNPLQPYATRARDFGNTVAQGNTSKITTLGLLISYQIKHNLNIDLTMQRRTEQNTLAYYQNISNYVGIGMRFNVGNRNIAQWQ